MTSLIVDASVGVKWYLAEEHSDIAKRLLTERFTLHVPELFYTEIANILWKRARAGEMTLVQAQAIVDELLIVDLKVHPSTAFMSDALQIGINGGRTIYDSLYISVAVREGLKCITADKRLYNALSDGPFAPYLLRIDDLPAYGKHEQNAH